MKISILIITKNEEDVIAGALESVKFADETIVLDSFSTDHTVEIAKSYAVNTLQEEFKGYAKQRENILQKASNEWVLYLDADERVTEELRNEIEKIISTDPSGVSFFVPRKNFYLGKLWPTQDKIQRLFKKTNIVGWKGDLHETPEVLGTFQVLKNHIIHLTHRDINSMLAKTAKWSEEEARLRFLANHPKMAPWRFIRVMLTSFYDSFVKQKGYKNGIEGWIESIFQMFSTFITYARLWELQRTESLKETYKKIDKNLPSN